jgi:hypothetical protein
MLSTGYLEGIKERKGRGAGTQGGREGGREGGLSLIHISEPTRHGTISYAVFCV